jgi:hypothetical protein
MTSPSRLIKDFHDGTSRRSLFHLKQGQPTSRIIHPAVCSIVDTMTFPARSPEEEKRPIRVK